jgi:hypothetical protein
MRTLGIIPHHVGRLQRWSKVLFRTTCLSEQLMNDGISSSQYHRNKYMYIHVEKLTSPIRSHFNTPPPHTYIHTLLSNRHAVVT